MWKSFKTVYPAAVSTQEALHAIKQLHCQAQLDKVAMQEIAKGARKCQEISGVERKTRWSLETWKQSEKMAGARRCSRSVQREVWEIKIESSSVNNLMLSTCPMQVIYLIRSSLDLKSGWFLREKLKGPDNPTW